MNLFCSARGFHYLCRRITENNRQKNGMLYIIPTPVGNLEDMTLRAVRLLKEADVVLAEDTRTSGILLKHFDIQNHLLSHHKFNEHQTAKHIVERLLAGQTIALISDAGTPGISDPGFLLVRECIRAGVEVQTLPGATAFVPALVASGISSEHFTFYGFLSSKEKKMNDELEMLKDNEYTLVFYEAPHRLIRTLEAMLKVFGDRIISISREISKVHESVFVGKISEAIDMIPAKGEFVIVVSANSEIIESDMSIIDNINMYIKSGLSSMDAIKRVAKERKIPKNDVYKEYHEGR